MGHESKDSNRETEAFLKACQGRGIEVVPSDDIVAWLQSLPRTNRGDSPRVLDPSLLSVLPDGSIVQYPGRNPSKMVRSFI